MKSKDIYLVDTHVFLWSLSDPKKLSKKAIQVLENKENSIYLSTINVWEICIKYSLGKLKFNKHPKKIIEEELETNNFKILDLKLEHIFSSLDLPKIHNDPFDRLLISQCNEEKMKFITNDSLIEKYKVQVFW